VTLAAAPRPLVLGRRRSDRPAHDARARSKRAVLGRRPLTPAHRSCENRGRVESTGDDPTTVRPAAAPSPQPAPGLSARFRRDLGIGVKAGLRTFWERARVMFPAYGITLALERLGVIRWLAHLARPLLSLLGLRGDAAVPPMVGWVLNIDAASARCRRFTSARSRSPCWPSPS